MKLRCIIVDDEYLARQRLLKLLEEEEDIQVVAECRNGREALEKIELKEPDLVFLDVQMPDIDGFGVLQRLDKLPYVIFTTAYDSYAIKAFDVNAVDYLLKPFDEERLQIALERMFDLKRKEKASELESKIHRLISNYEQEESKFRTQFEIKKNGRIRAIPTEDIEVIHSGGNYLELQTATQKFLYRTTMNTAESELDPEEFIRVHRSLILNRRSIKSCHYLGNSEYRLTLKSGEEFVSGRSYKQAVIGLLDKYGQ